MVKNNIDMTADELKLKLQYWINQIGVYNEGCMCWWGANEIQKNINKILNEYKEDNPGNKPSEELTQKSQ